MNDARKDGADFDRKITEQIELLRADYVRDALAQTALARRVLAQSAQRSEAGKFAWVQVGELAHIMKGQGSTFDYPAVTRIADLLCQFVRRNPHPPRVEAPALATACLDALEIILQNGMRGTGDGASERLVERLRRLMADA